MAIVKVNVFLVVVIVFFVNIGSASDDGILSRRKRYVVFPEGASLTIELCFTINVINMPTNIFTEIVNFGINYDLPNKTGFGFSDQREPEHMMQRRQRREIYRKMEILLDAMGFGGRPCIYRALCEASQNLHSKGKNLYEELLRIIFSFPQQTVQSHEPEEHRLYHRAHRMGFGDYECFKLFPECRLSIIDVMLGYRSRRDKDTIK